MATEITFACPNGTPHQIQLSWPVWIPEGGEDDPTRWEVDFEAQPWKSYGECWCLACEDHVWPVRVEELGLLAESRRAEA